MTCRRCSDCRDSTHHWIPNSDFGDDEAPIELASAQYVCKHCPELGDECPVCYGDGEAIDETYCDYCDGKGVIIARQKI